mmetsp:Transcript_9770/g.21576  ORF Transcript_9770/g.21576 Transcript_9770/m.21576 type:complete len:654 (+) Transcript_9770:61-2022(+)
MRAGLVSALLLSYAAANSAVSLRSKLPQSTPLRGLQIGSFSGGVDVVYDGKLQKRWSRRYPMDVDAEEHQTDFWLWWETDDVSQAVNDVVAFNVSVMSTMPEIAKPRLRHETSETRRSDQLSWTSVSVGQDAVVVSIEYECLTAGSAATMMVSLEGLSGTSSVLEMYFRKSCASRAPPGVSLGTDALGLHSGGEDVACNGLTGWPISTAADRVLASEVSHLDLFWLLRPSGGLGEVKPVNMNAPEARVLPLACDDSVDMAQCEQHWKGSLSMRGGSRLETFDGVSALVAPLHKKPLRWQGNWSLTKDIVGISFTGAGASGGLLPIGEGARRLRASFHCHRRGLALVEVELSAGIKYQPFKPISLSFLKVCADPQQTGFDVVLVGDGNVEIIRDGHAVPHLPLVDNKRSHVQLFWRDREPSDRVTVQSRVTCDAIVSVQMQDVNLANEHDMGRLSGSQEMRFQCQQPGVASCWLQFGWNDSQSSMLEFEKACGGKASDIAVTARVGDLPVGAAKHAFLQGTSSTTMELVTSRRLANFSIVLTKDRRQGEQLVTVGRPEIRVSSDVVHATLAAYTPKTLITTQDIATLVVQTACQRSGSTQVHVDVPLGDGDLSLDPLHFVIHKRCDVQELGFLRHAFEKVVRMFLGVTEKEGRQ